MATFLETLGLSNFFAPLFSALLVMVMVGALLTKTKILGGNKAVDWILAIVLGILVLAYPDLVSLVNFIAPWFVLLLIFLLLLIMVYRIFGISEESIADYMKSDRPLNTAFVGIAVIILLAGIFTVFGQRALQATTDPAESDFNSNLFEIIFSPKVLGVIMVMAVAIFTVGFLGGAPSGNGGGNGGGHGGGHH